MRERVRESLRVVNGRCDRGDWQEGLSVFGITFLSSRCRFIHGQIASGYVVWVRRCAALARARGRKAEWAWLSPRSRVDAFSFLRTVVWIDVAHCATLDGGKSATPTPWRMNYQYGGIGRHRRGKRRGPIQFAACAESRTSNSTLRSASRPE